MAQVHTIGQARTCGARTVQQGNTTVSVGDQLWAVEGDPNDHGNGQLIAGGAPTVSINDKTVIVVGDSAQTDNARHPNPAAAEGSSSVSAGA